MLNPLMLLGLLGLSVPVIIHLIQRQRMRPMLLATLAFLDREETSNAFAPVPKDVLQLLLRLLLMLVFILLMTRLTSCSGVPGPRTLTVVLDRSLSMQQIGPDGRSLFERSRAEIRALIDGLRPEDRLRLVLVDDTVVFETGFSAEREWLAAALDDMTVGYGGGVGMAAAVRAAVDQLRATRAVNAMVLVFSAHRREAYTHALYEAGQDSGSPTRWQTFRQALDRGRVQLVFIDPGPPPEVNLAIESALFMPPSVYLGSSARMSARVRNHSAEEQRARLTFYEDERGGMNREFTIRPHETMTVDLVHAFESPIDVPCHIELDDDGLPGDNRFFLPMRMRERRQVLLVTPAHEDAGDGDMALRARGADLFFYALNPGEALGRGAGTFVNVRRVSPAALDRVSLPFYSVVVLYDVDDLTDRNRDDLAAFVEHGGGIYLIPGEGTAPARFNHAYASVLQGFVVGRDLAHQPGQPLDMLETRLDEPWLLPLLRGEWGDIRHAAFRRYHSIDALRDGRVLLRAANDEPLAVLLKRGQGRVCVQLFSCSLADSSLPRSAAFVPLVQTILEQLRPEVTVLASDTLRAGEMLRLPVPAWRGLESPGELVGPVARTLAIAEGLVEPQVRIADLTAVGAYELRHPEQRTGRRRWITVNPVAGESELTPLSAEDRAQLFGTRRFVFTAADGIDAIFVYRREWTGALVSLLLAVFALEAAGAAWQSRRTRERRTT